MIGAVRNLMKQILGIGKIARKSFFEAVNQEKAFDLFASLKDSLHSLVVLAQIINGGMETAGVGVEKVPFLLFIGL